MLRPIKQYLPAKGLGNWNVQPMQPGRTAGGRACGKVNTWNVKRSPITHLESGVIRCADHVDPRVYRELASEAVRIGTPTFQHMDQECRTAAAGDDMSALDFWRGRSGGVRVSFHVPAVAAKKRDALIRVGVRRDGVAVLWQG